MHNYLTMTKYIYKYIYSIYKHLKSVSMSSLGHYYSQRQGYAPFGSVSKKKAAKKAKLEIPGPGSYDISLPMIS